MDGGQEKGRCPLFTVFAPVGARYVSRGLAENALP